MCIRDRVIFAEDIERILGPKVKPSDKIDDPSMSPEETETETVPETTSEPNDE